MLIFSDIKSEVKKSRLSLVEGTGGHREGHLSTRRPPPAPSGHCPARPRTCDAAGRVQDWPPQARQGCDDRHACLTAGRELPRPVRGCPDPVTGTRAQRSDGPRRGGGVREAGADPERSLRLREPPRGCRRHPHPSHPPRPGAGGHPGEGPGGLLQRAPSTAPRARYEPRGLRFARSSCPGQMHRGVLCRRRRPGPRAPKHRCVLGQLMAHALSQNKITLSTEKIIIYRTMCSLHD